MPTPAPRVRRRRQGRRSRLRARRRVPPAPRSSDCRSAYRCCRKFAGRTARRRDRRSRTRMKSSDRSVSCARRSSDRVGRRRGRRAWRSPECVRSSADPSGSRGETRLRFIGRAKTVKACETRSLTRGGLVASHSSEETIPPGRSSARACTIKRRHGSEISSRLEIRQSTMRWRSGMNCAHTVNTS